MHSQASSRRHKDDEPQNNALILLEELSSVNTRPQETDLVVIQKQQEEPVIRLNFNGVGQAGQIVQNDKKSQRSVEEISGVDYERRLEDKQRPQPHEMLLL